MPILKQGEEVRSYGSHLLGRMHHIPSQKAHSMKVRRKPPFSLSQTSSLVSSPP
jgi:hypothetical protein